MKERGARQDRAIVFPQACDVVKLENEAKLGIRVSKKTSVFETFETLRTEKHGFPAARRELPEFQKSFS